MRYLSPTVAHLRRFAISEAEGLYFQAWAMLDQRDAPDNELLSILLRQALAEAYVEHGTPRSLRKADSLLNWQFDTLQQQAQVGPIHTTILLKTLAHLCWKQQSHEEWRYFAGQALDIARSAGLQHQADQIRRQYVPRLNLKALYPPCPIPDVVLMPTPQ